MKVAGCRLRVARGTTVAGCRLQVAGCAWDDNVQERTNVHTRTGNPSRHLKQHKFYYVVLYSVESRSSSD
jgi:hypothetical protein